MCVAIRACVYAARAWKVAQGQLDELRNGAQEEKKRIATERVAVVIADLTTGAVAEARNAVTSMANRYATLVPPDAPTDSPYVRRVESLVDDDFGMSEQRQAVFKSLWALHRAGTVVEELQHVDAVIGQILAHHVGQMVSALNLLGRHLTSDERDAFAESAASARGGVAALQEPLNVWFGGDEGPLASLQVEAPVVEFTASEWKAITSERGGDHGAS